MVRARGGVVRLLIATAVVTAVLGSVAVGTGPMASAQAAGGPFQLGDRFDRAVFTIRVAPNGSARWVFRYERPLENDTEVAQFRTFAERFRTTETPLYRDFRNQSRALVAAGARTTGRNMTATRFSRDANVTTGLGNRIGVVEMAFTWTGFGVTRANGVVVGDVFEGGLYIGPEQTLVIEPAGDLRFDDVLPAPTSQEDPDSLAASGSVTWQGERSFADGRPRVEFVTAGGTPGSTTTGTGPTATTGTGPGGGSPTSDPPPAGSGGIPIWAVGVVGVMVVIGVAVLLRGRGGLPGGVPSGDAAEGPDPGAGAGVSDEALMDDERRVRSLLEANGGRMRQSAIVEETGWSKSKVSMVLSDMEDADEVSKLRVGRENIVSLPGEEPDAAGSPYGNDTDGDPE